MGLHSRGGEETNVPVVVTGHISWHIAHQARNYDKGGPAVR